MTYFETSNQLGWYEEQAQVLGVAVASLTMATRSAGEASLAAAVTSAALFLGTALLSRRLRKRECEHINLCSACRQAVGAAPSSADPAANPILSTPYYVRRMEDRLSFQNLLDLETYSVEGELFDEDPINDVVNPEPEEGPRNSNWSHFELPTPSDSDTVSTLTSKTKRVFSLEGDFVKPSKQDFVWTEAGSPRRFRVPRPPKGPPSSESSSSSSNLTTSEQWSSHPPSSLPTIPDSSTDASVEQLPAEPPPPRMSAEDLAQSRPFLRTESLDDRTLRNGPSSLGTRTPPRQASSNSLRRSTSQPDLLPSSSSIRDFNRSLSHQVRVQNRLARAHYNARIMPNQLILVRHGQSMGNTDEKLYSTIPDNAMPLTPLGWEQARAAGKRLRRMLGQGESVHFIVSPYVRTVETFHGIVSAWCDPREFAHITNRERRLKAWYQRLLELGLTWHEDPRIREQDFGNYQDAETIKQAKSDRHRFGAFYYRFPYGESASDVFDRISTFLDSLWRSFDMNKSRNYVLVTHGISIRVLLARYFRYTIDQFNLLANPRNCEMIVLAHDGKGRLQLTGRHELELQTEPVTNQTHVVGCKFHKRLKVLPPDKIRKVKIRISPDD